MCCEKYEDLANEMLLKNDDLPDFTMFNLREILRLADGCIDAECFMKNLIKMDVFSTKEPILDPWNRIE